MKESSAEIIVGSEGWVTVEADGFVPSIHPDCSGKMGELRDAALRVHELIGGIEKERNTVESSRKPQ